MTFNNDKMSPNHIFLSASTKSISKCIKTVTVIGGGKIGSGIAQVAAQNAQNVLLVEQNEESLRKSFDRIVDSLSYTARDIYKYNDLNVKKYIENTMVYLKGTTNLKTAVEKANLVIEAIPENFDKKIKLFKSLNESVSPEIIFATTTDSLSVTALAEKSSRKERFLGIHFFHPVVSTKLVEVVKHPFASPEIMEYVIAWCRSIGKTTITCNDSPGFVVNRLLITYITEAIRLMEKTDASRKDIDEAMRSITGQDLGPIQLADHIGHDTIINLVEAWRYKEPENMIFQPCSSQKRLVEKGKLGTKTGEGFYKYNDLNYWIRTFAHLYKNKKDWSKYYQIWRKAIDKKKKMDLL